ncbi:MAG: glycosyltransferase family 39 protein [Nitrospinae bacterium]|nr:glycosyltransferase family 39 protein [Nitrospinota bacterium]
MPKENKLFTEENSLKNKTCFIILFLVPFITYFQVFTFQFAYDDFYSVLPMVGLKDLSSIPRYFYEPVHFFDEATGQMGKLNYYRPLANLTLTLDFYLFGNSPGWFHIENLLLHILNSSLIFLIFKRLIDDNTFIALTGAVLYSVFPLSIEIISIYHYRVDLIVTLFIFLTLFSVFNTEKNWFYITGVLFFLAMLCKETAIILLLLIPLLRLFYFERINWKEVLPVLVLPMLFYWSLRFNALGFFLQGDNSVKLEGFLNTLSFDERLLYIFDSLGKKVSFLFLPFSIPPKVFVEPIESYGFVLLGLTFFAGLLGGSLFLRNIKLEGFLCLSILISWFPVSSILISVPDFASPRFFYYSAPWLILLLLSLIVKLPQKAVKIIFIGFLLLFWSVSSYFQKNQFRNNLSMSLATLNYYPKEPSLLNVVGLEYKKRGDYILSERYFKSSLHELEQNKKLTAPLSRKAFVGLTEIQIRKKEFGMALNTLERALTIFPEDENLYYLKAVAYFEQGNFTKGIEVAIKGKQYEKQKGRFEALIKMAKEKKIGDKKN